MSSKRYVRLLPSDFTTPIAASPGAGSVAPPPLAKAVINQTRKRKRVGTQLACNLCRLKKIRCDGTRPSCKICAKRSEKCVYNEKRDATQDAVDIVELLSLAPYSEALEALRLLRTTGDGPCCPSSGAATTTVGIQLQSSPRRAHSFRRDPR
ncbi:hypothetical protein PG995_002958 [Apiospora arundinis]